MAKLSNAMCRSISHVIAFADVDNERLDLNDVVDAVKAMKKLCKFDGIVWSNLNSLLMDANISPRTYKRGNREHFRTDTPRSLLR
jgi:hypothetical protein